MQAKQLTRKRAASISWPLLSVFVLSKAVLGTAFFALGPMLIPSEARADINNLNNNGARLRIRVGGNGNGNVDTVVFDVPGMNVGDGTPVVSTNAIPGSSGIYTVRFVMDTKRILNGTTGNFYGDSSSPMTCDTPITCGSESVDFDAVSWVLRDGGDMMGLASSFDNTNQLLHSQTLPPLGVNGLRYRDYAQFSYSNTQILPAGTYRGTVVFTALYPE